MQSFQPNKFWQRATAVTSESEFNSLALELFYYQSINVPVYRSFIGHLKINPSTIHHFSEIPFLPVTFFKNHIVTDQLNVPDFFFSSSGTSGQETSRHYIHDKVLYEQSLMKGFELVYGHPEQFCILALLPSYLERKGSSLVFMFEKLIQESKHIDSGFYLYNHDELHRKIGALNEQGKKIFLAGVTYALLDFFEKFPGHYQNIILMETGGMKGRRKEMVKKELYELLKHQTGIESIHSEYGMTELLSQAYSTGDGKFKCPPWMKVQIKDIHDPFELIEIGKTGTIEVIDLANIHSCAFLSTQDLGRKLDTENFEVLGRIDNSELRGCNLMVD